MTEAYPENKFEVFHEAWERPHYIGEFPFVPLDPCYPSLLRAVDLPVFTAPRGGITFYRPPRETRQAIVARRRHARKWSVRVDAAVRRPLRRAGARAWPLWVGLCEFGNPGSTVTFNPLDDEW